MSGSSQDPVVAVILTALDEEARAVVEQLTDVQPVVSSYHRYTEGRADGRRVVVWPMGTMGNVSSGIATRKAIALHNPGVLILAGITGGFRSSDRSLGDVLVPDQIVQYDTGKLEPDGFVPRWEVFRPTADFRTAARYVSETGWWEALAELRPDGIRVPPAVHFGVLASGEKVVADNVTAREIQLDWDRAAGVEMEGVGVALAAYESPERPGFGVVKGISDWADSTKADDWRPYASRAAAVFALRVIRAMGQTIIGARPQPQIVGSTLSAHASAELKAGWGRKRIALCRRLTDVEAAELADWFDIPVHERVQFAEGTCRGVWGWLERRRKLSILPTALTDLGREDLVSVVEDVLV